jgi:hypothetical protein
MQRSNLKLQKKVALGTRVCVKESASTAENRAMVRE